MISLNEIKAGKSIINTLESEIKNAINKNKEILYFGVKADGHKTGIEAMRDNIVRFVANELDYADYKHSSIVGGDSDVVRFDIQL